MATVERTNPHSEGDDAVVAVFAPVELELFNRDLPKGQASGRDQLGG
jgi:hypothetical protein